MESALLLLNPTEFFSNPKPLEKPNKNESWGRDNSKPPLSPTRPSEDGEAEQIYFPASPTSALDAGLWNSDLFPGMQHSELERSRSRPTQKRILEEARPMPVHHLNNDSSIQSGFSDNDEVKADEDGDERDGDLLGLGFLSEDLCKMVHVDMGHFRIEPPRGWTF
eukprot:CAMPEP_0198146536 /NCGR_PEP_ID=MMETSP1443-20131203/29753_1 /TAXON_ID=186043 /ORGANISM="Entomoneis sp., Strain CCMP2396" /LENGTH=164 /DNA_ID=CAMNT_0043810527 /DNA_START=92 /DNA_END=586 /DNA_ORIENTATION=-